MNIEWYRSGGGGRKSYDSLVYPMFVHTYLKSILGQRTGCLTVVLNNASVAKKVESQMAIIQRSEISNPPAHGARIVNIVLHDPELYNEW